MRAWRDAGPMSHDACAVMAENNVNIVKVLTVTIGFASGEQCRVCLQCFLYSILGMLCLKSSTWIMLREL